MAVCEYRCFVCGRIDKYGPTAKPVHCGKPMSRGEPGVTRSKDEIALDLVVSQIPPDVAWMLPGDPDKIIEVWQFRPGKRGAELLGWIGERATCFEWRVVEGVPNGKGVANTRNEAIESIYNALQQ